MNAAAVARGGLGEDPRAGLPGRLHFTLKAVLVTNLIRAAEPNAADRSSVNVWTEPVRQGSRATTVCVKTTGGQ